MKAFKGLLWKLAISGMVIYLLATRFCDVSAGVSLGQYPLEAGWQNTGLAIQEVALEGWGKVSSIYETREQLRDRLHRIEGDLGLISMGGPMFGGDTGFRYVNDEGRLADGSQVIITIQSMEKLGKGETHLGFTLHRKGDTDIRLGEMVPHYEQTLQRMGVHSPLSVAISGETAGRLGSEDVEKLFGRFFKGLEASRVDGGLGEDFHAWRGKTRLLPTGIDWAGEKINVETTAAYDDARDVTVITLATPAITEGI